MKFKNMYRRPENDLSLWIMGSPKGAKRWKIKATETSKHRIAKMPCSKLGQQYAV